jgi:phage terminase large subunit
MQFLPTTALKKILKLLKRLKIIQGGSSAGKTIAILLALIDIAQTQNNQIISVVSESMPHLKRAAMRDFLKILATHKYYNENNWNATDSIYTFPETGSIIEFFPATDSDKVHGPRRDYLFINECNNVPYEVYTQLALRTNKDIYLDYNPVMEFWVHDEIMANPDAIFDFIILTYLDNEGLPDTIISEIEALKRNEMLWRVYGLGILGELQGQIYKDWRIIHEIPHEARLERIGVDFGYTNDPTAIIALYYYNGGYILDELAYQKQMSNKMIADVLKTMPPVVISADAAEPKSIDELKGYDLSVVPSAKGKGSINHGIQLVQQQRISMTERSINLIKEYRNYSWATDALGKVLKPARPVDVFNHGLDAVRYAFSTLSATFYEEQQEEELAERRLARLRHTRSNR